MKKLVLLALLFISFYSYSQVQNGEKHVPQERRLEATNQQVDEQADFPLGYGTFRSMIVDNFRTKKVKGTGKISCSIKFAVEKDGSITDIKATGSNESFNKEAIRAISKIDKKWTPAKYNGEAVRSFFQVPIIMFIE